MLRPIIFLLLFLVSLQSFAQQKLDKLTVEKIMRDPKWIGTSPTMHQWSADGRMIWFNYNPEKALDDSLYYITLRNKTPVKASVAEKQNRINAGNPLWTTDRTAYTYNKDGDIYFTDNNSPVSNTLTIAGSFG